MDKKPLKLKACYFLGLAGIIGAVAFLLTVLALDIVQSGSNPVIKTISDLVHGSYGWLQSLAFALVGFWFFVFVSRLYSMTVKRKSSLTAASFLGITSIGFLLIAVFPSQTGALEQTIQGIVHDSVAGLISASFIIGCLAFAIHFRKDPQWKRYWTYTTLTVIACLVFALLWALIPLEWQLKGLGERLLLTSGFAWVVVISLKMLRLCRQPQEVERH
jgi:hypothetical protein